MALFLIDMDYPECPACSGKDSRVYQAGTPGAEKSIRECMKCGAVYGTAYPSQARKLVYEAFTADPEAEKRAKYFDLTIYGPDRVRRRHGWFDPQSKLMTQSG